MQNNKRPSGLGMLRRELLITALGAALFAAAWIVCGAHSELNSSLVLAVFLVPYVLTGFNTILGAFDAVLKARLTSDELLITLASAAMLAIGSYHEAVGIMLIYRLISVLIMFARRSYSVGSLDGGKRRRLPDTMRSPADAPAKIETKVSGFVKIFTPMLAVSGVLFALVPSISDGNWVQWTQRGVVFLLASCTCSLVSSVELCYSGGISCALNNGVAVTSHLGLSQISDIGTVALDKTGTVTEGSFTVTQVEPVGISAEDLLTLAAAAESSFNHPIAQALKAACTKLPPASLIKRPNKIPGRGIEVTVCGRKVLVGNIALMNAHGVKAPPVKSEATIIHVAADGRYGGYIVIDDRIRSGAKESIRSLRSLGVENIVLLTGDSQDTGNTLGYALGANDVIAELVPEQKAIAIKELTRSLDTGLVAFVGDPVSDSSALNAADVSVAEGRIGDGNRLCTAYLLDDDISKLPLMLYAAKRSVSYAKRNFCLALTVKGIIIILGLFGLASVWLAAAADGAALTLCALTALNSSKTPRGKR